MYQEDMVMTMQASSIVANPWLKMQPGRLPEGALQLFHTRPPNWNTTPSVVAGSLVVIGSFTWAPLLLYFSWRKCKTRRQKTMYIIIVAVCLLYPTKRRQWLVSFPVWGKFIEYFSTEIVGDEPIPEKPSIYAVIPHGTFPFGLGLISLGPINKLLNRVRPVVASAVLRFPAFGSLIGSVGGIDASPGAVTKAIKEGASIGICPGGIAEMYLGYPRAGCSPNEEYALLQSRKGFIRMAMKHGVSLVPVYCFGNTHAMHKAKTPWVLEALSRLLRTSLIVIWGRWGLPVPYRLKILYAFGKPLKLLHKANPTQEEIDEAHAAFCEALTDLFDRYKMYYGWGHKTLNIV